MLFRSEKISRQSPLGYLGVDLVVDAKLGPQVLEINVRPGLEIQNVNAMGLRLVLPALLQQGSH